jgi:hypothetical protein
MSEKCRIFESNLDHFVIVKFNTHEKNIIFSNLIFGFFYS